VIDAEGATLTVIPYDDSYQGEPITVSANLVELNLDLPLDDTDM
jgi:hypothetical protein